LTSPGSWRRPRLGGSAGVGGHRRWRRAAAARGGCGEGGWTRHVDMRGGGAGGSAVAAVAAGLRLQHGAEAAATNLQQDGPILSVDPPGSYQALRSCLLAPPLPPLTLPYKSPRRSIQTAARPLKPMRC